MNTVDFLQKIYLLESLIDHAQSRDNTPLMIAYRTQRKALLKQAPACDYKPFHDKQGRVFEWTTIIRDGDCYYAIHTSRVVPVERKYFLGNYYVEKILPNDY